MSLRELPAMHRLLNEPSIAGFAGLLGSTAVKETVDGVLTVVRREVAAGAGRMPSFESLVADICRRLERLEHEGLLELINGTGIILHTNLGRAPVAREALDAVAAIAGGYSNLEFDLEGGERGSRYRHVGGLLRELSAADDALVVNNCAAAVLLVLDTFAKDREVVVARKELVEVGGGFRMPDVLARSGAILVEVGTTNKVYLHDFERALSPRTGLILRTHPSNYRIEGFVADVRPLELAALGRRVGIPVVEDLGSGAFVDLAPYGLPHERTVQEAVAEGLDLVAFSGDKLLGGPQAGIIVGKAPLVARLRANPLLRALRVDKATLAALGATLRLYLEPGALERIPIYAMLGQSVEVLRARAGAVCEALGTDAERIRIVDSEAFAGGGTTPIARLNSIALAIASGHERPNARAENSKPGSESPNDLAARLRLGKPPVVGRVHGDDLLLDLRTIPPARDRDLSAALMRALG